MQNIYYFFLGNNPTLSATEVWRVLRMAGLDPKIVAATSEYLAVASKAEVPIALFSRLGGSDRVARLLGSFDYEPAAAELLDVIQPLPPKWAGGMSVYGTSLNIKNIWKEVKKLARERNSRVKFVLPSSGSQLNAAQVLFNGLYRDPNVEFVVVFDNNTWHVLRTVWVQDIQAYERRDTSRASRDQKVGMLPPKLAQIMINIAASQASGEAPTVLDPFCGMGTVLQEGWLMGYQMVGSDVSSRMVEASAENLQQLQTGFDVDLDKEPELLEHDARSPFPPGWDNSFEAIVTEPFLGEARRAPLSPTAYESAAANLGDLYTAVFRNVQSIIKPGAAVLFLLPAFKVRGEQGYFPLPGRILDQIGELGYSRVQLVPEEIRQFYSQTDRGTVLYYRPDAIVAREFTLWQRA